MAAGSRCDVVHRRAEPRRPAPVVGSLDDGSDDDELHRFNRGCLRLPMSMPSLRFPVSAIPRQRTPPWVNRSQSRRPARTACSLTWEAPPSGLTRPMSTTAVACRLTHSSRSTRASSRTPSPQAVYQTVRYGNPSAFTYTIPNLTPGASLQRTARFRRDLLRLRRPAQTDVSINGVSVLTNFDIFAATGAMYRAIAENFIAYATTQGQIVIQFSSPATNNPMVNGIAVTPLPGAIAIDAGGTAAGSYVADTDFSGGTDADEFDDQHEQRGHTRTQQVYQTVRYGTSFAYTIPHLTPGASYNVRLDFAESYFTQAGQRVFDVSINGVPVLTNFDAFAVAGGENIAIAENFVALATTPATSSSSSPR